MKKANPAKELYQRLRLLSCDELWSGEVAAFDQADARGRMDRVGVIRAVGVVFSESGSPAQKDQAREWLRSLLHDPEEKIRRYAITALPKIGATTPEEKELLALLEKSSSDREKESLGRTLGKIGGAATLEAAGDRLGMSPLQKVQANVLREENPGSLRLDRPLENFQGLTIHLHCREGLEKILEEEIEGAIGKGASFRQFRRQTGLVVIAPLAPFTLGDIFQFRCFATAGIHLGAAQDDPRSLAALIASPATRRILEAFTDGPIRYRLEYTSRGHQRASVQAIATRVYEVAPALLNDARQAPWQIDITHASDGECSLELTPRLRPDPRFAYRQDDVPAASHPPLAAAMARLAGLKDGDIIWDPFCGSGLELVERARLGGVRHIIGTDLSEEAVAITRKNLTAALKSPPDIKLVACDFRDHLAKANIRPGTVSLIITNPPMGRRVPIPNLPGLIASFLSIANLVLKPGGRLVFANPLSVFPKGATLGLEVRQRIDLGGFHVHLEKHVKSEAILKPPGIPPACNPPGKSDR